MLLHRKGVILKMKLKHVFSSCLPGEAPAGMAVGNLGNLPSLLITGTIVSACSILVFQAAL